MRNNLISLQMQQTKKFLLNKDVCTENKLKELLTFSLNRQMPIARLRGFGADRKDKRKQGAGRDIITGTFCH